MRFYYIIWRGDIIEICSFMSLTVNNNCNSYFSLIITFFSCKPNLCFFKKNIFFLLLVKQFISMLPFDNREGADGKFRTGWQWMASTFSWGRGSPSLQSLEISYINRLGNTGLQNQWTLSVQTGNCFASFDIIGAILPNVISYFPFFAFVMNSIRCVNKQFINICVQCHNAKLYLWSKF